MSYLSGDDNVTSVTRYVIPVMWQVMSYLWRAMSYLWGDGNAGVVLQVDNDAVVGLVQLLKLWRHLLDVSHCNQLPTSTETCLVFSTYQWLSWNLHLVIICDCPTIWFQVELSTDNPGPFVTPTKPDNFIVGLTWTNRSIWQYVHDFSRYLQQKQIKISLVQDNSS